MLYLTIEFKMEYSQNPYFSYPQYYCEITKKLAFLVIYLQKRTLVKFVLLCVQLLTELLFHTKSKAFLL